MCPDGAQEAQRGDMSGGERGRAGAAGAQVRREVSGGLLSRITLILRDKKLNTRNNNN